LMEQLVDRCPVVSMECGLPGVSENTAFAASALDCFLRLEQIDGAQRRPLRLFEILHRVEVRHEVPFAFGTVLTDDLELVLAPGLDAHNFGMLLAGTPIGRIDPGAAMPLIARSVTGLDMTERFFDTSADGHVVVAEDVIPVMMTTAVQQTRRDCLFYIARRRA
ncbi:MAG TPA: hypothetical protein VML96_08915, partial [Egibacteraceae bacterium]|nr:hypothetical protein [Egibacteraceae bacterium]